MGVAPTTKGRWLHRLTDTLLIVYLCGMLGVGAVDLEGTTWLERVDLVAYALATLFLVVSVLRRDRPASEDRRPTTLLVCAISTSYFLAFEPADLFGAVVLLHVLGDSALVYLGRSFSIFPARRAIRTGWLYRWVRHPAYGCYMLTDALLWVSHPSAQNIAVAALGATTLVVRALREEALLAEAPEYRAYMERTRWRFLPFL